MLAYLLSADAEHDLLATLVMNHGELIRLRVATIRDRKYIKSELVVHELGTGFNLDLAGCMRRPSARVSIFHNALARLRCNRERDISLDD